MKVIWFLKAFRPKHWASGSSPLGSINYYYFFNGSTNLINSRISCSSIYLRYLLKLMIRKPYKKSIKKRRVSKLAKFLSIRDKFILVLE